MQESKSLGRGVGGGGIPITGVGLGPRMMTGGNQNGGTGAMKKKKLPSPKDMVAHYESKGMQPQEASLKVIDDLQNLLFRIVTTNKKATAGGATEMDAINARLLRLEAKLDSKPGYPQTLAIGVVSGAVFRAIPHVAASVSNIWNSVRSSTSSSP